MFQDYLRLIRFDKPIGTLLLLWPTWWGLWLAYAKLPPLMILVVFTLGVFLTRSAGCAINDFADADFDGQVERTKNRPLVTGAISRKQALLVTASLSVLAFILAAIFLSRYCLMWSIPALLIFISYPFFKRFFAIPQLYLGIAFSFGILMAFAEAGSQINFIAVELFFANLLWVLAYDTIYALVDIEDDQRLHLKTSAITFGKWVIHTIGACYVLFILLLTFIGYQLDMSIWYFAGVILAGVLAIYVVKQIYKLERHKCFKAFLFNNYIGMVVFIGIALNYGVR